MRYLLLLLILTYFSAAPVPAVEPKTFYRSYGLLDRVRPDRPDTVADLLRMVERDLRPEPGHPDLFEGRHSNFVPDLPGVLWNRWEGFGDPYTVYSANGAWVECDGQPRLLLAFQVEGEKAGETDLLALYAVEPHFRLITAVEIGRETVATGETLVKIAPGTDAFFVDHYHGITGFGSFDLKCLVGIVHDRFRKVLDMHGDESQVGPSGDGMLISARDATVRTLPSRTAGFYDLAVTCRVRTAYREGAGNVQLETDTVQTHRAIRTATWDSRRQVYRDPFEVGVGAQVLTGTVYHCVDFRFWSEVSLVVAGRLHRIWVDDHVHPQPCPRIGEIWRFRVPVDDESLVGAAFTGRHDPVVTEAVSVLMWHYRALAAGNYQKAWAHLSKGWQAKQSVQDLQAGNSSVEYNPVATFDEDSIKVIGHNANEVLILAPAALWAAHAKGCLRYSIIRQDGAWVIDRCDTLPYVEYVKG